MGITEFGTGSRDPEIDKELENILVNLVRKYNFPDEKAQSFKVSLWHQGSLTWEFLDDERREGYRRWVATYLKVLKEEGFPEETLEG